MLVVDHRVGVAVPEKPAGVRLVLVRFCCSKDIGFDDAFVDGVVNIHRCLGQVVLMEKIDPNTVLADNVKVRFD